MTREQSTIIQLRMFSVWAEQRMARMVRRGLKIYEHVI